MSRDPYDEISDANEMERLRRERAQEAWNNYIDRLVEEAQQKGMFDNLPGRGKPLKLNKNPYAEDKALAFEILQNNNFTLPWIADRNELLDKIAAFRVELDRAWRTHEARLIRLADPRQRQEDQHRWSEYLRKLEAEIAALNKKIARVNLNIPVASLEILKLDLDRELKQIGAGRGE